MASALLGALLLSGCSMPAGGPLARVWDFDDGPAGWTTAAGRPAAITDGRSGGAITDATVSRTAVLRSDGSLRPLARGQLVRVTAWVWTARAAWVRLGADQVGARATPTKPADRWVRTRAQRWTRASMLVAGMGSGSQLALKATASGAGAGVELRLDDVRVETVRDTAAGWLSNGCATNAQGIPSCGTYLGATYGSNSDPSGWEREMGTALGVRRTYFAADQVDWAMEVAAADIAAGRLPWISFKLPDSWESVAAGSYDEWAESLATRLSRLSGPIWVAFHHEPEGDGPIDDWVAMQRRLSGIVHDRAPRVAYTVILTGWHQVEGDPEYSLDRLVPEDLDVDLVGFDLYNWLGTTREDGTEVTKATPVVRGYLDRLSSWARQRRLSWALAETAQTDLATDRNPAWLSSLVRAVERRDGKAVAWFNTRLNADPTFVLNGQSERREFGRLLRRAPALRWGG